MPDEMKERLAKAQSPEEARAIIDGHKEDLSDDALERFPDATMSLATYDSIGCSFNRLRRRLRGKIRLIKCKSKHRK